MQWIKNLQEWFSVRPSLVGSVGFVPTMGNLHAGHMSLLQRAVADNDVTVCSIFVNPTQFGDPKDLERYPRTLEDDLDKVRELGVDYVLTPTADALYPDDYVYQVVETQASQCLEGRHRPLHFNGVLTIVLKLLNIVKAATAYFGEKDYQQFQLIHDMTRAFFMDTRIVSCPTIRAPSGLALSSRNHFLSDKEKIIAANLWRLIQSDKSHDQMIAELSSLGFEVDYLEAYQGRRYVAARLGAVRLIDNIEIASAKEQIYNK